jgi:hypothetical protein
MTYPDRAPFETWAAIAGYRLYDHSGFSKAVMTRGNPLLSTVGRGF